MDQSQSKDFGVSRKIWSSIILKVPVFCVDMDGTGNQVKIFQPELDHTQGMGI